MLRQFREFAIKGNVVDMAVGIIIGAAFTAIVNSVVGDIFTPLLGVITGDLDFTNRFIVLSQGEPAGPYPTIAQAEEAGAVVLGYGRLFNEVISFVIVAVVLFLLVRWANQLRRSDTTPAPTTRACPFCKSHIDCDAVRCAHCTSEVEPVPST